jgi:hypothetical protein
VNVFCIAPDGVVLQGRNPKRLMKAVVRDVRRRPRAEVHRLLVDDAVKRTITDLIWATAAYVYLGGDTGPGAERAFVEVLDAVEAQTGLRLMPGVMP